MENHDNGDYDDLVEFDGVDNDVVDVSDIGTEDMSGPELRSIISRQRLILEEQRKHMLAMRIALRQVAETAVEMDEYAEDADEKLDSATSRVTLKTPELKIRREVYSDCRDRLIGILRPVDNY